MLSESGKLIVKERYCNDNEKNWREVCKRVAKFMSKNEKDKDKYNNLFFEHIFNLKFLPASPVFFNAGDGEKGSMSPCFGLVVQDDMESIMENATLSAMILKYGGGVGINLSLLRPKGSPIKTTHGKAMGPVNVLKHYDSIGTMVAQAGKRDAAMLALLDINHADIKEFIIAKDMEGTLSNFNISVKLTGKELENNTHLPLIVDQIYKNGEPGLLFFDNINNDNFTDNEILNTVNPCGETPTVDRGNCCLGSINLVKFFEDDNTFDWKGFENTINIGVRFLDNLLDLNLYPDETIKEKAMLYRQIGLGIMGLADLFILYGYRYGDEKSIKLTEEIFKFMNKTAHLESIKLGKERGFCQEAKGMNRRNATILSVAPTGSLHRIANVSPGIEPNYAKKTESNILGKIIKHTHPLSDMKEFVTAIEIEPFRQLDIVAAAQQYVDLGISKTVNLPNNVSKDVIKKCIKYAYEKGLKGLTFYRDGSRKKQQIVDSEKTIEERPFKLIGETYEINTGLGKLYVTINGHRNKPIELFCTIGKGGNDVNAFTEAIGRLVSQLLRNGVTPERIANQLKSISGNTPILTKHGRVTSVADAIGQVLIMYINDEENIINDNGMNFCPNCNNSLEFSEGCESCSCGYSRC